MGANSPTKKIFFAVFFFFSRPQKFGKMEKEIFVLVSAHNFAVGFS